MIITKRIKIKLSKTESENYLFIIIEDVDDMAKQIVNTSVCIIYIFIILYVHMSYKTLC